MWALFVFFFCKKLVKLGLQSLAALTLYQRSELNIFGSFMHGCVHICLFHWLFAPTSEWVDSPTHLLLEVTFQVRRGPCLVSSEDQMCKIRTITATFNQIRKDPHCWFVPFFIWEKGKRTASSRRIIYACWFLSSFSHALILLSIYCILQCLDFLVIHICLCHVVYFFNSWMGGWVRFKYEPTEKE